MSNKPKYIKIMNDLAQKIKNNELKPGDQIPTEKELCEIYDASRMTVNKAIMMLCENI
ncbi:GntR family transcriptional regulator [Coprobacillaceae bacterium CR2/5/TPMF4]|nr:GntR family transcriptional regulator [Coprobacillaceae bacterium CR2/5/TPMF4]